MAKQIKKSFTGGLDRDTSERLMSQGDYRYALNVRNIGSESNQVGVIENVKGNKIPATNYVFPNLSESAAQEIWFAPGLAVNDTVTFWVIFSNNNYTDTADLSHTDANSDNIPDSYYLVDDVPYAETDNGEKMYPVTGNGSYLWGRAKMWVDFVNNYKADLLANFSVEVSFFLYSEAVESNIITYNASTALWEIEDYDVNNETHNIQMGGVLGYGSNQPLVTFTKQNIVGESDYFFAYLAPGTFNPIPSGTDGTTITVTATTYYNELAESINNTDYTFSSDAGDFSVSLQKSATYNVPDYGDDYDIQVSYNCIGAYEDTQEDKIYYFVASKITDTNENAYLSHILEYDLQTDAVAKVFRDTANFNTRFFDWEFEHKISNIDKMGDILYWTHELYGSAKKLTEESKDKGESWGGGEPCSINVKKAKATLEVYDGDGVSYFPQSKYYPSWFYSPITPFIDPHPSDLVSARERKLEFVQVIKRMPKYKPVYRFATDETRDKNNVFGFSWQFKYRYHYWDGEVSSWSPISNVNASLNLMTNSNIQDPAIISTSNKINVFVRNASQMVEFIEVAARKCKDLGEIPFGNRGEFFSIAKVKNNAANWQITYSTDEANWIDEILYTKIEFYNDKIYTYTDPIEGMNLFDKVPRRAKTQTVIGDNRLAYANYIDGFNLPDSPIIKVNPRYHENDQLAVSTIIDTELVLYPFWTDLKDSTTKRGAYAFNQDRDADDSSGWSKDLATIGTKRWAETNGYNGGDDYYPSFTNQQFIDYFSGPSSIDSNGNQVYCSTSQYEGMGIENPILTGGLEYVDTDGDGNADSTVIDDWTDDGGNDWSAGNSLNLATVRFSGKSNYNQWGFGNYCGIHSNAYPEGEGAVVVEDGNNWKKAQDWDTSSVSGQYGATQTGQFYIWNPLARLYTDDYGQPSGPRHDDSGFFCGSAGGGKNGYAKIRFNFNYESLEQEFEVGATIVLTMNFKSCVWLENDGGDGGGLANPHRDAYKVNELGDFNKTWIIRCPESLDSIDEQMKWVTHVISDWGETGGPGTDNDTIAGISQGVFRDATGNDNVGLPFWNRYTNDAKENSSYASSWTWTNRPMALVDSKILTMELSADVKNNFGDGNLGDNLDPADAGTRLTTDERGVSLAFNIDPSIIENMGETNAAWEGAQKAATMKQATNKVTLEYKKSTALMLEGLANNVSQTFKTGAYHDFGLIYYDLEGRCSTVAIDTNNSTYVKFPPESKTEEEIVEDGGDGFGPVSLEWEINHRAPTWARFFRWAYARNSSVDDFIQFLGRKAFCSPSDSDDNRIYLSFNSFRGNDESYVENDDPLIEYQFVKGDRIRFMFKKEGGGYATFNSYIDVKLSGMNYYDANMTEEECPFLDSLDDEGTDDGFYLEFHEVSEGVEAAVMSKEAVLSNVHIYNDVMFEVYRPKKSVDPDKTIYYEYGPLYRILPEYHLHTGDVQNQSFANQQDSNGNYYTENGLGAKGTFVLGDVWYKPRIMKASEPGTTVVNFVEDYFLNDFYDTNHFSIGRINVYSPYAKERHHAAGVTWSEVYNPEMSYNGLSTFLPATVNYKNYEITDGSIQKIVGRDTDMIMIHEDRTHRVAVNKDIMVNASGQGNMGLSSNVLGNAIPYPNFYGMSKNSESLVREGNVLYWTDIKRGAVVKLTGNIQVISEMKMIDYFRDKSVLYNPYNPEYGFYDATVNINDNPDNKKFRLLSGYNPKHLEYMVQFPEILVLAGTYGQVSTLWENSVSTWNADLSGGNTTTIEAETVSWTDRAARWTTFYSHNTADYYGKINRTFVSWKNGQIYIHDSDVSNYCSFYPTTEGALTIYDTKLEFPFTQAPSSVKTFKVLSLEGNQAKTCTSAGVNESTNSAYDVTFETELISTKINRKQFDERERIQYAQIPFGLPSTGFTSSGSEWIGLGQCAVVATNVTGTNTTFESMNLITAGTTPDPVYIFISEVAYQLCTSGGTAITVNSVTSQTALVLSGNPVSGDNLMYLNEGVVVTSEQAANNVRLYVKRSGLAEGDTIKGTYAKALLTKKTKEKVEIIAVNSIISKSELSDR